MLDAADNLGLDINTKQCWVGCPGSTRWGQKAGYLRTYQAHPVTGNLEVIEVPRDYLAYLDILTNLRRL